MSSATSVNDALAEYLAGRMTAERVVVVVAAAYYREQGAESREPLRPLIEIIERAHPGVVELTGSASRPGFAVRLAERPFPKRFETEFRETVEASLAGGFVERAAPGFFARIVSAIRRVFGVNT